MDMIQALSTLPANEVSWFTCESNDVKYLITTLRNGVLNEMQCGKGLRP